MTCNNCRYAQHLPGGLICRRYPPVPLADTSGSEVGEQGDYHMEVSTDIQTHWPEVTPNDWCGEHSLP